jgi:sporulation protein YlmC with PRC-barrel domain
VLALRGWDSGEALFRPAGVRVFSVFFGGSMSNVGKNRSTTAHGSKSLSATTLIGDPVVNPRGEDLGKIEDFVIDPKTGRVDFAVLSFGGFLGVGDKLFAVPLEAMKMSPEEKRFILDVDKERLKQAPGFDKNHWPDITDRAFGTRVYNYYGYEPRWS